MKRPRVSEATIQIAVADHLRRRARAGVVWFHVPNGGLRAAREARKLKLFGVLPGVADIILISPPRGTVYALELKASNGRASEAQLVFKARVDAAGGYSIIAEGLDEALEALRLWELIKGENY